MANRGWGILGVLAVLAGCAAGPGDVPKDPVDLVAPVGSETTASFTPDVDSAKTAKDGGQFLSAFQRYIVLANTHPVPEQRAEFLFQAAECKYALTDYYAAYRVYSRLLLQYPTTPRFGDVVLQIFEIARLFAEGKAEKPSWFFGMNMTDREFGIEILEAFQKARERHPQADDALHYKALALYELDEWDDAIATWQKLIKEYPESDWVQTAHYRIGLTMLAISDGPAYDKGPIRAALNHLTAHVKKYPKGDYKAEASAQILTIQEGLAGQWLKIARFYLRVDQDYSATIYLTAIDREYPHTEVAKVAKKLQASIPKRSPPPAPADPEGLEAAHLREVDRYQAPPPDPAQPKPSD